MKTVTIAIALGIALGFLTASVGGPAQAKPKRVIIVTPPTPPPYWDSYIVPRYRYRAEDDRVDPCGGPAVPVIRYGPQEVPLPLWLAGDLGFAKTHGRDWPCRVRSR